MEPEKQENAPNPLLAFIQANPVAVVVTLTILILISLGSVAAMLRIQGEATAVIG
jgi:hypothetical protein